MGLVNPLGKIIYKIKKFTAGNLRRSNILLCLITTALLSLIALVLTVYVLTFSNFGMSTPNVCYFDLGEPSFVVNKKFLSLGLDSTVITDGFKHFNMTDPKLIKMMKYLSPAYLRIGGNQADQIIFCKKDEDCIEKYQNDIFNQSDRFILWDSDWLKLHKLAKKANLDVIYDLNSLLRSDDGSWNATNAMEMISFSQDNGLELDWELGNEPNSYEHKFNTTVDPMQLGIDFQHLRTILDGYELYKTSYLVGPSTTRLRTKEIEEYFTEFLVEAYPFLSAVTWHHYYFSGVNATPSEFLDPDIFNYLKHCITTVTSIVRCALALDIRIWLGETSSAWHSGAPNLSDRFIAGFIWIDKLGLSAQLGIDVVVRQSIFKGHYALINDSYYPNPDWWLSILYNQIVDTSVFNTVCTGDEKIRLYAHCAKENPLWAMSNSTVVVFGVNIQNREGIVQITNLKSDNTVFVYEITSESSLFSQYVRLNGIILELLPNLDLPDLTPNSITKEDVFIMPAYSIVFWIFTNTDTDSCALEYKN